jgi:cephalosporin hydroxylase
VRPTPRAAFSGVQLARGAVTHGAMQKRSEFAALMALLVMEPPRRVIEIGLGIGGTFWALCQVATRDAVLVSVDLPAGPFGGDLSAQIDNSQLRSYGRPGQELHLLKGNSTDPDLVARVTELVEPADLLFIDGDHTYEGVSGDYRLYAPLVRPGGRIVLHDILPCDNFPSCEVDRFWNELPEPKLSLTSPAATNEYFGGRWGGIGVLQH